MGNSIDMYAKAFHGSEIVSLTDVEEPECKALLYLSRYIDDRRNPLELLKNMYNALKDLEMHGSPVPIHINVPAGTTLFRSYIRGQEPVKPEVTFCDPSPMGNLFIRNATANTEMAILTAKKDLKLINFIPISMLFGCQIKAGRGNDPETTLRGLFSFCCPYALIRKFCEFAKVDGIILTDSVDYYAYTKSKSRDSTEDNEYVPSNIYPDTPGRDRLDKLMEHHLKAGLAFPKFVTTIEDYDIQGAIYPEFIFANGTSCVGVRESVPFDVFYTTKELYEQYDVKECILHRPELNGSLQVHHDLRARQYKLTTMYGSPYLCGLPHLFDKQSKHGNDAQTRAIIRKFFTPAAGGKVTKRHSSKTKKRKLTRK
jgi:hypothetical protein